MRKLMLEDVLQLQVHSSDAAYRDAKLAIIDRSRPGRRLGDVNKFPLRVENDDNVFRWLVTELTGQVAIRFLQRWQELLLQFGGSVIATRKCRINCNETMSPPYRLSNGRQSRAAGEIVDTRHGGFSFLRGGDGRRAAFG